MVLLVLYQEVQLLAQRGASGDCGLGCACTCDLINAAAPGGALLLLGWVGSSVSCTEPPPPAAAACCGTRVCVVCVIVRLQGAISLGVALGVLTYNVGCNGCQRAGGYAS